MRSVRPSTPVPARAFRALAWIGVLLLALGCTRAIRQLDLSSTGPGLQGFVEGVTTRQDIVSRLGRPAATYEEGRVAVWFLDKKQRPREVDGEGTRYHLVAVIGEEGIVQRLSLLRVR